MRLASCKSALNPPVVYSTDRSKAVVLEGRYALDHFVPVVLVGTLAERHAPADPFGRIGYIE